MGKVKVYDVAGVTVEGRVMGPGSQLRLNDRDAERLGLKAVEAPKRESGPTSVYDDQANEGQAKSKKQAAPKPANARRRRPAQSKTSE